MRRFAAILVAALCLSCGESDAESDASPPLAVLELERYSPAHYDDVVSALVPVEAAAQRALDAFVSTRLLAQEVDLFDDDVLEREGSMILLGHDGGRVVGLTTRYAVDLRYPDTKLVADGFGAAEIGAQRLRIAGHDPVELVRPGVERDGAVTVRIFGDHGAALVYLPADHPAVQDRPTLALADPEAAMTDHLRRSSQAFGLEFTLISPAALAALRDGVEVRSVGGRLLVMGAALALDPVLGAVLGAPEVLDPAILDALQQALAKLGARELEDLTGPLMDRFEMFAPLPWSAAAESLPGPRVVALHSIDSVTLDDAGRIVIGERALGWRGLLELDPAAPRAIATLLEGSPVVVAEFDAGDAVVLVPQERLVLNLELACHGLAATTDEERPGCTPAP